MFVKKPIGIGLAIGLLALAFTALPAMAQAAGPTLRSGGAIVKVGTHVVGTSTNLVTEAEGTTLTCEKVTLTAKVASNPPAKLSEGTGTATGCKANGAAPVTITSITFSDTFLAGGKDEANLKFVFDVPSVGLTGCILEGTNVPTTWTNGSAVIGISGNLVAGAGTGAGCPKKATIKGNLTLETDEAETGKPAVPVTVNNE